ncbi:hypothetical protein Nepgr_001974 [Nepenthes gracilis]|uniref:Uncharacterized protein n=1 Tax=Nepenthes gracilis TaxID=150966 RepID=A0AAD3P3A2_NEPGR|nr:hypothetical protein Nepgr_001974 [Nepenthes gracilis]
MGSLPQSQSEYSPASHHHSLLQEVLKESSMEDSLIRSYKRSFNGFAAKLTDKERHKLIGMKDVVSVFPCRTLHLQTTRSWDFMGFPETAHRNPTVESDVIIGVIDSEAWPESESFNDEGLGPVPKKWKGACHGGLNFTCNKKIVGARYYSALSNNSARDIEMVAQEEEFPLQGLQHRVCNESSCSDVDILAAFDDAIADGVDIITISIGAASAVELNRDVIAIGAFHAMAKGVPTSHSANNSGPSPLTTNSVAPWLLSVAASNSGRRFIDRFVLGNGAGLVGVSIHSFALHDKMFPLLYGEDAGTGCDSLNSAKSAGAVGVIAQNYNDEDVSFIVPLPAAELSSKDLDVVKN